MTETNSDEKYDQLVSLLKILSIGTDEKYKNVDSKEFLSQFKCPVRYLHDKKTNDPSFFEQFNNEELLEFLLKETFIKSNIMPSKSDLKDMDAVFFSSGQLITLCENFITFKDIVEQIDGTIMKHVWITNMMAKYPTIKQKQSCKDLLQQNHLFDESTIFIDPRLQSYAGFIWKRVSGFVDNNYNVKFVECVNIIDTCKLIEKLISKHLPDLPNNILIVTVQPKQTALALDDYFKNKNYPHKFYFAKNTTEDIEKSKSLYFNESRGEKVRFLLRDLVEEIKD